MICWAAQTATQSGIAVECAEIAEQLAGAGEQHGVPAGQSLVSDVLGDHRLAGKRKPMAAYRFGSLEGTLFRPDESGQVSMIG